MSQEVLSLEEDEVPESVDRLELLPSGRNVLDSIGSEEVPGRIDPKELSRNEVKAAVLYLMADGVKQNEIARRLRIAPHNIYRVVKEIREMAANNVRVTTIEEYAGMVQMRIERIYERLMNEARTASDPSVRVAALKEAKATMSELVRVLQQMGIVYREPERQRIEMEVTTRMVAIRKIFIEGMEKFLPEDQRKLFASWVRNQTVLLGTGDSDG